MTPAAAQALAFTLLRSASRSGADGNLFLNLELFEEGLTTVHPVPAGAFPTETPVITMAEAERIIGGLGTVAAELVNIAYALAFLATDEDMLALARRDHLVIGTPAEHGAAAQAVIDALERILQTPRADG